MTPPEAPQPHRSPADRLAAIVLTVLVVLAGLVSLFVAPFFAMTPTVCGPGECRGSTVVWASVVSWAGVCLAAVLAVAGMVSAARRKTVMWVWPALALALVVVTFVIGAQVASSVAPGG